MNSFTATARRRASHPDVPEDVEEALLHLNDPNWDTESYTTATLSEVSFELEHKHKYASSVDVGPSLGSPTDFDSASRVDSRGSEAKLRMQSSEQFDDYEEYVCECISLPRRANSLYSESPYAEVRAAVANTDDPTMPVNTFRM